MKFYLTILMILILSNAIFACDCIMTPIENHIRETKFIVTVEVVKLLDKEEDGHYFQKFDTTRSYTVMVKVLNSYKGGLKEEEIIELGSDYSDCSLYFSEGRQYLLFLNKDKKTNRFFQKTCSYSETMEKASAYIRTIEEKTGSKKKE